ncbi:MAG: hypothetical protein Kow00124_15550 [Anaerolineae bacterium]
MSQPRAGPLIGVVGPCTSGKTTLVEALRRAGVNARAIAQEHSYVPDMWRRITNPDLLIYLDVSYEQARLRRVIHWGPERLETQATALAHARAHADLILMTDQLTAEEVAALVLGFIRHHTPWGEA